jgi:hypothetical protein
VYSCVSTLVSHAPPPLSALASQLVRPPKTELPSRAREKEQREREVRERERKKKTLTESESERERARASERAREKEREKERESFLGAISVGKKTALAVDAVLLVFGRALACSLAGEATQTFDLRSTVRGWRVHQVSGFGGEQHGGRGCTALGVRRGAMGQVRRTHARLPLGAFGCASRRGGQQGQQIQRLRVGLLLLNHLKDKELKY